MVQSDPVLVRATDNAFDRAFKGTDRTPSLMLGTVVSGDRFINDAETLKWLQREFAALATEMEGSAVGYTCQLNKVPFVVIRGLSDTAGAEANDNFEANLHAVCKNGYALLAELIPALVELKATA